MFNLSGRRTFIKKFSNSFCKVRRWRFCWKHILCQDLECKTAIARMRSNWRKYHPHLKLKWRAPSIPFSTTHTLVLWGRCVSHSCIQRGFFFTQYLQFCQLTCPFKVKVTCSEIMRLSLKFWLIISRIDSKNCTLICLLIIYVAGDSYRDDIYLLKLFSAPTILITFNF